MKFLSTLIGSLCLFGAFAPSKASGTSGDEDYVELIDEHKEQILKSLGLSEAPSISTPINSSQATAGTRSRRSLRSQLHIKGYRTNTHNSEGRLESGVAEFSFPELPALERIEAAQLRLFHGSIQCKGLAEFKVQDEYARDLGRKIIDFERKSHDGWLRLNFNHFLINRAATSHELIVKISVRSMGEGEGECDFDGAVLDVSIIGDVLEERQRRSTARGGEESDCKKHECCLKRFYLNFKDIGWDNWIIAPSGYSANYCTGTCKHTKTAHDAMMILVEHTEKRKIYTRCCVPKAHNALTITYRTENGDFHRASVPRMIVEQCGC